MLVAQRICVPQMVISAAVLLVHTSLSWLFIQRWRWGPAGAAAALNLSALLSLLCAAGFVLASGLQSRVWGVPSKAAIRVRFVSNQQA